MDVEVLSVNEKLVADDDDTTVFGGLRRSDGREEDNWRGGGRLKIGGRGHGWASEWLNSAQSRLLLLAMEFSV